MAGADPAGGRAYRSRRGSDVKKSVWSDRERERVVRFLARLAQSAELTRAFALDPDVVLAAEPLSPHSRKMLKEGDQTRLAAAFGSRGVEI